MDIHELMEDTKRLKEEFVQRKLFLAAQLGVLDKKINSLIKENAYEKSIIDAEYAVTFSSRLKELEKERRKYKDEFKIFCDIDEDNKFSYNMLGYAYNEYTKIMKALKRLECKSDVKLKNNGTEEFSIKGKTNEEVTAMVNDLKHRYSKVIVNTEEGIINCYNNCRSV